MGAMMSAVVKFVVLAFLTAISAGRAEAAIKICNNFSQTVYFSIAYAQPGYDESYISRGWLALAPNVCDQFDSALHLSVFWYYAETDEFDVGGGSKQKNMWGSVHPDKQMWVATNSFNFINNLNEKPEKPGDPGAKMVGFARSIEMTPELNETLTIEANGNDVTQATHNADADASANK
ncbi:hypothetical protein C7I87_02500 [Mesorhizobium sp. SARCC-RB16n]|uniref:DUF1036 domain-containing protein n=1 Tax=Mesorhizobium sp. SARCC-RB16n TaxID=2116687 RepID=UPI00122EA74B|nr:DUF1036 domain-containing protein [Mesorhizobium sp. SARCC-RB16n]KAA3452274.1 hypothetical protein C7I87_02500 [Mesorhizobium sp. SARCC-RB16n]